MRGAMDDPWPQIGEDLPMRCGQGVDVAFALFGPVIVLPDSFPIIGKRDGVRRFDDVAIAAKFGPLIPGKAILDRIAVGRQFDVVAVIQIPVLCGRGEREVRAIKTRGQKERLAGFFESSKFLDGAQRNDAIGVDFIRSLGTLA